eukprot:scaffold247265_cov28-Tisochrysis_lutea.AAC.3
MQRILAPHPCTRRPPHPRAVAAAAGSTEGKRGRAVRADVPSPAKERGRPHPLNTNITSLSLPCLV